METKNRKLINRVDILTQLRVLLRPWVDNSGIAEQINEKTNTLMDIAIDSVGILQLVLGIEKEFGITIKDYELDSDVFSRMANLIDIIEGKLNETN